MIFKTQFYEIIKTSARSSNEITWILLKVYVPLSILSSILKQIGFFELISPTLYPIMEIMGLPGKASITLFAGFFGNLYAGIATIPALELTARQVTILGIILGFSHSLIIETGILINLRFASYKIAFFRISLGIFSGIIANIILPHNISGVILNPYLKQSNDINWFNVIMGIITTLIQIWLLVFFLQFLYESLRNFYLAHKLKPTFHKFGSFFGLSAGSIIPWMVGLFFGIIYGSGIMLQFVKKGMINHKDASLLTIFLILAHAIIEDSFLFAIIGGNFWIIFLTRISIAFIILKLLSIGNIYKKLHIIGTITENNFIKIK
jgi:hypothetical protein